VRRTDVDAVVQQPLDVAGNNCVLLHVCHDTLPRRGGEGARRRQRQAARLRVAYDGVAQGVL
jgi:hypothetical protein